MSTTRWQEVLAESLVAGNSPQSAAENCIAAGAPADLVHGVVGRFVSHPLFQIARRDRVRRECRDWWLAAIAELDTLRDGPILPDASSLSRPQFIAQHYAQNRAAALPGVTAAWPAIAKWNRDYLSSVCGDEVVEIMWGRNNAETWRQNTSDELKRRMPFREYINTVFEGGPSNDHYMVSRNRFFEKGATALLMEDIGNLEIVKTRTSPEHIRMWFGPAGTVTPLHYDGMNNVIVQVSGWKTVRLFPPCYSTFMRQVRPWYAESDPDLSWNGADSITPPQSIRVELRPGDALFIPVGWWHALEAREISITLAFIDFGVKNFYGAN